MDMYALILAIFASSGLWSFVTSIYLNRKQKADPMEEAVKALLHDRINDIAQAAILRGCISFDDFDNLVSLYVPYRKMNGNGSGKSLFEAAERLERVENYTE